MNPNGRRRSAGRPARVAGGPAGRPASRPARDASVRTEWWLCLRLASGLAGWQSEGAAGRAAGHAEKAAGHLVKSGWPDLEVVNGPVP